MERGARGCVLELLEPREGARNWGDPVCEVMRLVEIVDDILSRLGRHVPNFAEVVLVVVRDIVRLSEGFQVVGIQGHQELPENLVHVNSDLRSPSEDSPCASAAQSLLLQIVPDEVLGLTRPACILLMDTGYGPRRRWNRYRHLVM